MAYFSGDVLRDGFAMAGGVGEIHLHTDGFPDDPPISHYAGRMDLKGWTPMPADIGTKLRLVVPHEFTMDIRLLEVDYHGGGEPATVRFISEGAPIVMPKRRALVPSPATTPATP